MRIALGELIDELSITDDVRVIIIIGTGSDFCAGGDIAEMEKIESPYQAQSISQIEENVLQKIQICPKPVIAAIHGACLGAGMDLALSCDFRIISPDVKMGFPEINVGIIVGGGGISKLTRYVSIAEAKEMLFTGSIYSADECLKKGLVNKIADNAYESAYGFAEKLKNKSLNCIAEYKRVLSDNALNYYNMMLESNAIARCFVHENRIEGIAAFLEKRAPFFK